MYRYLQNTILGQLWQNFFDDQTIPSDAKLYEGIIVMYRMRTFIFY